MKNGRLFEASNQLPGQLTLFPKFSKLAIGVRNVPHDAKHEETRAQSIRHRSHACYRHYHYVVLHAHSCHVLTKCYVFHFLSPIGHKAKGYKRCADNTGITQAGMPVFQKPFSSKAIIA